MSDERKFLARNRQARHRYHILETEEAGIALTGGEVKAVRAGRASLREAYIHFVSGQAYLVDCHISAYEHAGYASHEPTRRRRLLLRKRQIERFASKVAQKGLTAIPLSLYLEGSWIKVEIALARGKQAHDSRETLRRRAMDRDVEQALSER